MDMLRTKGIFILFTLIAAFLFLHLDGGRPFATPDEARYVEIPREMVEKNDFITPRLNAMKYFEKPPLFYWVQAAVQKCFGMSEGVMRVSIAAFALMGIALIFYFSNRFFSTRIAIFSAIILSTSILYYALSRLIILDMPFTAFVTGAFVSFYCAMALKNRRLWFYAFSAFCALGILTKGIVILVLVGPVVLIWLTMNGQWKNLRPFYPFSSLLIFLLITVPWHALAALKNPDFLYKYFYVEHFLRYTTTIHARYQPLWFFIPIIILGLTPWLFTIIDGTLRLKLEGKKLSSYLMLWCLWILFFFSFSKSKLIPYILPSVPPLSIIGAIGMDQWLMKKDTATKWSDLGIFMLFLLGVSGFIVSLFFKHIFFGCETIIPQVQILCIALIVLSFVYLFKRTAESAIYLQIAAAIGLIALLNLTATEVQKTSVKPLVEFILANKGKNDYIVCFENYYQDLPLYTKTAPVICVDAINELQFGMDAESSITKNWMLTKKDFINTFGPGSGKTFWAVATERKFQRFKAEVSSWKIKVIARHKELVLFYHAS